MRILRLFEGLYIPLKFQLFCEPR